jgi:hypothetical protein
MKPAYHFLPVVLRTVVIKLENAELVHGACRLIFFRAHLLSNRTIARDIQQWEWPCTTPSRFHCSLFVLIIWPVSFSFFNFLHDIHQDACPSCPPKSPPRSKSKQICLRTIVPSMALSRTQSNPFTRAQIDNSRRRVPGSLLEQKEKFKRCIESALSTGVGHSSRIQTFG